MGGRGIGSEKTWMISPWIRFALFNEKLSPSYVREPVSALISGLAATTRVEGSCIQDNPICLRVDSNHLGFEGLDVAVYQVL